MKTILLYSGGVDSTTLLYRLLRRHDDVYTLSFNYGAQHSKKELEAVRYYTEKLKVPNKVIDIPLHKIVGSSLLSGDIPDCHYEDKEMQKTIVPFRNGILLSFATAYADNIDADSVSIATHYGDASIFPDCTRQFNDYMRGAIKAGTSNTVDLYVPYADITKEKIILQGLLFNVDYSHTWTCYKGKDEPCGACGACVERQDAFEKAKISLHIMRRRKIW